MKKTNISQVDTLFANGSYPIEFLLYYKDKLETRKIQQALSELSAIFWPMFGEYQAGIIQFDKYSEKECFDEEVMKQDFDPGETNEKIYDRYFQIIPASLKKLFFLKIIQYHNGTVLIPKLNHLAGDGYSYFYFLSALAALCRQKDRDFEEYMSSTSYKPHHKRTILKDFRFSDTELLPVEKQNKLIMKSQEISKETVRNIIKEIAANSNDRVSTNDILAAMFIKKSLEIQKSQIKQDFQLTIPIDVRLPIKEYGFNYFGNGLMLQEFNFNSQDMEKLSVNRIALEIRKAMPVVTKASYLEYLNYLEDIMARQQIHRLRPYNPEHGCLVTNLSRLPVNRLDFGTGYPDFIFPLTIGKNAAAILADQKNYILKFTY